MLHWWVMNPFFSDLYNLIQCQSSFTMSPQLPYSYKFMYFYSNKNTCCWWAFSFLIPMLDSSSCDPLASSCPLFPPFNFAPSLLNLDSKLCHLVWCFVSFVRWFVGFLGLFLLREKHDDLCFYLYWIQWLFYKPNALVSIFSTCFTCSSQSNCHDFSLHDFFKIVNVC